MSHENSSADPSQSLAADPAQPEPRVGDHPVNIPEAKISEPIAEPRWTGCRYSIKTCRFEILCILTLMAVILVGVWFLTGKLEEGFFRTLIWYVAILIPVALCIWRLAVAVYRHLTLSYTLDHERLLVKRGFFKQTTDSLLVPQIDDIKKCQTLVDRLFNGGIGTIFVYAHDKTDDAIVLKGVDKPNEAFEALDLLRRDYARRRGIKSFSSLDDVSGNGSLG